MRNTKTNVVFVVDLFTEKLVTSGSEEEMEKMFGLQTGTLRPRIYQEIPVSNYGFMYKYTDKNIQKLKESYSRMKR